MTSPSAPADASTTASPERDSGEPSHKDREPSFDLGVPDRLRDDRPIRVELEPDVAVEVSARNQQVDVTVEGQAHKVERYGDLGPALRDALAGSGFSLNHFGTRQDGRSPSSKGSSGAVRVRSVATSSVHHGRVQVVA